MKSMRIYCFTVEKRVKPDPYEKDERESFDTLEEPLCLL